MRLKKEIVEALERAGKQIPMVEEHIERMKTVGIFEQINKHSETMRRAGIFEDEETNEVKEIPSVAKVDEIQSKTETGEKKGKHIGEQDKDRHIKNLQNKVLVLRKKNRLKNTPTREELFKLVDECRKKNDKINYSKLGREKLGVSYHTAKKWCDEHKIE